MAHRRSLRREDDRGPKGKLICGVRAYHQGPPTLADLEEAGLTLDSDEITIPNPDGWLYDREAKDWRCTLWADNWPAMNLYTSLMRTQWRHGFAGPTGLDYNVLLHELDRRSLSDGEYDDLFGAMRVIEGAVLAIHSKME